MTYDNTNRGVLFGNRDKKTEKSPDYSGTINIDGRELNLSGWKKVSKKGGTFLSLAVSEKRPSKPEPKVEAAEGFDDEIPF